MNYVFGQIWDTPTFFEQIIVKYLSSDCHFNGKMHGKVYKSNTDIDSVVMFCYGKQHGKTTYYFKTRQSQAVFWVDQFYHKNGRTHGPHLRWDTQISNTTPRTIIYNRHGQQIYKVNFLTNLSSIGNLKQILRFLRKISNNYF